MKGILFKDFLSAKRILTIYLLMIICFSFGGAKGVFFALCYSIMVPVNLLGFDERSRFDRYASVLPLTGLQCVADKYIVTYLCMAVMMALSSLIVFIRTGAASAMEDMLLYALMLSILRHRREQGGGIAFNMNGKLESFKKLLPFEPTAAQFRAMRNISSDMAKNVQMNRLF